MATMYVPFQCALYLLAMSGFYRLTRRVWRFFMLDPPVGRSSQGSRTK